MHWLIPLYSLREPQTKTILLFLSLIKEVLTPLFRKMKCSFCASRLIISCVNPPPDCLIPTEYLTKSLKSLALYLAQGIMGGINIHRHDLVFIILEIERGSRITERGMESGRQRRKDSMKTGLVSRSYYVPFFPQFCWELCSHKASAMAF